MKKLKKRLDNEIRKLVTEIPFNRISMVGGITISEEFGGVFDLNDAVELEIVSQEVVKRVKFRESTARDLLEVPGILDKVLKSMSEELINMGCTWVSFAPFDGDGYVRFLDINFLEIRAFGMRVRK